MLKLMPGPYSLGGRVYFVTIFFFFSQNAKVLFGIHLNTWKSNVCSMKSEAKMMRLQRIRV